MGAAARKYDTVANGPVLRLLRGGGRRAAPRSSRSSAAQLARCRSVFHMAMVVLTLVMGLGLARVQVTVQATEASLAANTLKQDIENERIRAEMLEADRTALATPSRIESIAGVSMGMGLAEEVGYLELPPADTIAGDAPPQPEGGRSVMSERVGAVLADVMRMSAGEAQVLLVGDAGLVSSR